MQNFFPQVGHGTVGDLELIGKKEYPMRRLIGKWDSPSSDRSAAITRGRPEIRQKRRVPIWFEFKFNGEFFADFV